jgi:uncharacterized RDD family membrane protein YckC
MSAVEMKTSAVRVMNNAPQTRMVKFQRAPFVLRCGAFLIDYTLLVGILAVSTLFARAGGGSSFFGAATMTLGFVFAAAFLLFNYIALPAWTGRTIGKWATGLRIFHKDAEGAAHEIGLGRALLRHPLGYALSCVTLGMGFLLAAFNSDGRALHDFIAGTTVVRD